MPDKFSIVARCNRSRDKAETYASMMGSVPPTAAYRDLLRRDDVKAVVMPLSHRPELRSGASRPCRGEAPDSGKIVSWQPDGRRPPLSYTQRTRDIGDTRDKE